jgi:hypothetical protein
LLTPCGTEPSADKPLRTRVTSAAAGRIADTPSNGVDRGFDYSSRQRNTAKRATRSYTNE